MTIIKLKTGELIDLAKTNRTIKASEVDSKSVSIFNQLDQNYDNVLTVKEMKAAEVAELLYNDIKGWGTKDSFDANFNGITKDNVIGVLKSYKSKHSNGLLHDIAREYEPGGLSFEKRVDYLKKIKNMVSDFAKNQNLDVDLEELSKEFDSELNSQCKSGGRMDVSKMDGFLNYIIEKCDSKHNRYDNATIESIVKDFSKIKSSEDATKWVSRINSNNIEKVLTSKNGVEIPLIDTLLHHDKINDETKKSIITKFHELGSSIPYLKRTVASNSIYSGLDSGVKLDYKKLIDSIEPSEMHNFLIDFEDIAHGHNKDNRTPKEIKNYRYSRGNGRGWRLVMPQAIMNCDKLSKDERRDLLNQLIDKAAQTTNYNISSSQKQRYIKDAKLLVNNCPFSENSNADLITILIFEILPDAGKVFDAGGRKQRILNEYGYSL